MTTIHLTRHGDVHNPEKVYYGRIPGYRLSDIGREQALSAGKFLSKKPITAIFASPQQRTQETASIIAEQLNGLSIITDDRLNEVHSPFDGITTAELEARNFDLYTGNQPPHEHPLDIQNRVMDFMRFVRKQYPKQEVVAVSHGDVLVFAFMFAKQAELNLIVKADLMALGLSEDYPVTASVLSFTFDDEGDVPSVVYTRPY